MRNAVIAIVLAAIVVGFLGYTKPGHSVMNSLGLTAACSSDNCN
jgi:hypothetical protein